MAGCWNCRFFRRESESWELDHLYYYVCDANHKMEYLKNFGNFKNCKLHEPRAVPITTTFPLTNPGARGRIEP